MHRVLLYVILCTLSSLSHPDVEDFWMDGDGQGNVYITTPFVPAQCDQQIIFFVYKENITENNVILNLLYNFQEIPFIC